jgi:hypothetical protein
MQKDWLLAKISVEAVELKMAGQKEIAPPHFLLPSEKWENMKRQLEPTDELWEYCSPQRSWKAKCGRAGYCILRDGEIVASAMTLMN